MQRRVYFANKSSPWDRRNMAFVVSACGLPVSLTGCDEIFREFVRCLDLKWVPIGTYFTQLCE